MKLDITNTSILTPSYYNEIDKIIDENFVANGGQLMYRRLLNEFDRRDIMVVAKADEKCVGFTYLRPIDDTLYVMQVAVLNDYKNRGVASAMYDYIKHHSAGFKMMTADIRKRNTPSLEFHKKQGFEIVAEQDQNQYFLEASLKMVKDRTKFKKKQLASYTIKDGNEDEKDL